MEILLILAVFVGWLGAMCHKQEKEEKRKVYSQRVKGILSRPTHTHPIIRKDTHNIPSEAQI